MADKTIGELDNSQITSVNDLLIFENANGVTKNVKFKDIFSRNGLTSPLSSQAFLMRDFQTGDIGAYGFYSMIGMLFMSTLRAGNGITITAESSSEGLFPVISCTASMITVSDTYTLSSSNWNNNEQTITMDLDLNNRNVVDPISTEMGLWQDYGVFPYAFMGNGITFKCKTVPEESLSFKVTSMTISNS